MVQITKKIALEVSKPNTLKVIVAKQGDNRSRYIKATFVNDNKKIEIPPSATATINASRGDGTSKRFAGEVNTDGTVTVPLTAWILELGGIVECDISVFGEQGSKLTTSKFIVEVECSACDDDEISEDENYDILIQLIEDVKELQEKGVNFTTDETLTLKDGVLSVNTASTVENDNTLPITSAAVAVTVGNIEVILKTI